MACNMRLILSSLILATLTNAAPATFTVFDIEPTGAALPLLKPLGDGIVSFKPLGVGRDGATTYERIQFFTVSGISANPTTTVTAVPDPVHATFVADSSHNRVIMDKQHFVPAQAIDCSWGTNGRGSCVAEVTQPLPLTTVYSGNIVPIFTLTIDNAAAATPTSLGDGGGPASPASGSPASPGSGSPASPGSGSPASPGSGSPASPGSGGSPVSPGNGSSTGSTATSTSPPTSTQSNAASIQGPPVYIGAILASIFSLAL